MEKKIYELTVDPELERVAPPLAENELLLLTEDILEHGCKFPLIVWDGIIVDGHNRYRICKENNIPFGIEEMEFSDKTEARLWIVRNQLGRRNLSDFQRCEMVLPLEEVIRAEAKKRMSSKTRDEGKKIFSGQSRDIMADMAGVSFPTLKWVKVLTAEADEETLEKLRSGEMKIHTAYTQLKKKEKPKEEPTDEDKPPVVAAYLEGSIPFEPVQRDSTPAEIEEEFDGLLDGWRGDIEDLLAKLTEENTTDELIESLHAKLDAFYHDMTKAIGREE